MKWVQIAPGHSKLVDDSDERPAIKPKHHKGTPPPNIHIAFTPSWRKYEDAMKNPLNKRQAVAGDKFFQERERAMKTDPKAKAWEEGRKAEWARNKPQWVKEHSQ